MGTLPCVWTVGAAPHSCVRGSISDQRGLGTVREPGHRHLRDLARWLPRASCGPRAGPDGVPPHTHATYLLSVAPGIPVVITKD